jgi:branched-chain amino acid transport system substrate-binding protein
MRLKRFVHVVGMAMAGLLAVSTLSVTTAGAASKKSTWVVGYLASAGNPCCASTLDGGKPAITAWGDWINAQGGINGHHVTVVTLDDAATPATAHSDLQQLVQQDHIIALVGELSVVPPAWETYIEQQGIPVIGGLDTGVGFGQSADWFPAGTIAENLTTASFVLGKKAGGKTVAYITCTESASCASEAQQNGVNAKELGLGFHPYIVSSTAPSYAAPCLSAKATGADIIALHEATNAAVTITEACLAQGWKPIQVSFGSPIVGSWATTAAFQGLTSSEPDAPFFDASTPAMKEFQAALTKYAPQAAKGGAEYGEEDIQVWAGGQLFAAAAKAGHLGNNPTPKDVIKGLYSLPKNTTLGGISPPLNFVKGKPTNVSCYYTITIKNDKFVEPNGSKTSCLPAPFNSPHSDN